MSIGLLLITHGEIGRALLATATRMFGTCPLRVETLPIAEEGARERLQRQAFRLAERLDSGAGVLVLTDLFGSTPANIAQALRARPRIWVISGVNLPMLVRVFNYPDLPLSEIAGKAAGGGKEGILVNGGCYDS